MAILFVAGGETGTNNELASTLGSAGVTSAQANRGTYSYSVTGALASNRFTILVTGNSELRMRFWIRFSATTTNLVYIYESTGVTLLATLTIVAGKLQVTATGGTAATGATTISINTWYRLDLKYDNSGGSGSHIAEVRLSGAVEATSSNGTASGTPAIYMFGAGAGVTTYFDDIHITNDASYAADGFAFENDDFTDDSNNYSDALAIVRGLNKDFADDTNNYADALAIIFNFHKLIAENTDNYADALTLLFTFHKSIAENTDNYADALALLFTFHKSIAEDSNNYADALAIINNYQKLITEDTNNYSDALALLFNYFLTLSEDSNNYNDAVSSLFITLLTLSVTETSNNYSDAISLLLELGELGPELTINDVLFVLRDSINFTFPKVLSLSDNSNNLSDAVSSTLAGAGTRNPSDTIGTDLGDNLQVVFGIELNLHDALNIHDDGTRILGSVLNLADSINNFQDDISVPSFNQYQLNLSDSINNFYDRISISYSRTNPTTRSSLTPYIRRYLNDVEVN